MQIEHKKISFIKSSKIIVYMDNYRFYNDQNSRKNLDVLAQTFNTLLLPSGRCGNIIALALEVNNYEAAEYLIDNSERLGLNIDKIAVDDKKEWNLKEEYIYSKLKYKEIINERLEEKIESLYEDKKVLIKSK